MPKPLTSQLPKPANNSVKNPAKPAAPAKPASERPARKPSGHGGHF